MFREATLKFAQPISFISTQDGTKNQNMFKCLNCLGIHQFIFCLPFHMWDVAENVCVGAIWLHGIAF